MVRMQKGETFMTEGMISVIIPVYNSAPYLELCLESVLLQKKASFEILLIDDGSSDYSQVICQEYAGKYPNVKYFQREHTGAAAARNFGISFAEGEYLYFLDSDDYLLDGTLGLLLDAIQGADLAIGGYKYQYGNRRVDAQAVKKDGLFRPVDVIHLNCIGGNKLYRTEIVQEFDIQFPILLLGEDLGFYHYYLSVTETVSLINDTIFVYRMHEGSLSKSYGLKALDYLKVFEQIERAYRNHPDMKKEFVYDEMFYLKGNIKRLPRYKEKKERLLIFDKYRHAAAILPEGNAEAEKMRKWILHASRFLYCGTAPVFLHQKMRNAKHFLAGTGGQNG